MNRRSLIVFGVVIAALLLIAFFTRQSNEQLVSTLLSGGWTTDAANGAVESALRVVTRGTRFAARWNVNAPLAPDRLNVYILRPGLQPEGRALPARFASLLNNCAFAGAPNVVICDAQFLDDFSPAHGVRCFDRDPRARTNCERRNRTILLTWVLGHELGHIVNGDPPAHFGQSRLDEMVPSNSIAQSRELRADAFLIAHLRRDDKRMFEVVDYLIGLLNWELSRKLKKVPYGVGILYDYTHKQDVQYATLGDHPEFVVRCVRMLDGAQLGDGLDYELHDLAAHMKVAPAPHGASAVAAAFFRRIFP